MGIHQMTKRDFIATFFIRNSKFINSEEDADKAQKKAEMLWNAYNQRNPTVQKQAKEALTPDNQKTINAMVQKWNSTPGVRKDRTKPQTIAKVMQDIGFNIDLIGEINRGMGRYLEYMVNENQAQYIPGLQVWLKEGTWKLWQETEEQKRHAGVELQKALQELHGVKRLFEMNPKSTGLKEQVEMWEKKVKGLQALTMAE